MLSLVLCVTTTVTAVAVPSRCSALSPPPGGGVPSFPWLYTCWTTLVLHPLIARSKCKCGFNSLGISGFFFLNTFCVPCYLLFLIVLLDPGSPTPYLPAIHPCAPLPASSAACLSSILACPPFVYSLLLISSTINLRLGYPRSIATTLITIIIIRLLDDNVEYSFCV